MLITRRTPLSQRLLKITLRISGRHVCFIHPQWRKGRKVLHSTLVIKIWPEAWFWVKYQRIFRVRKQSTQTNYLSRIGVVMQFRMVESFIHGSNLDGKSLGRNGFKYLQQQHMVNLNQKCKHYMNVLPSLYWSHKGSSRLFGVCRPVLVIDVTVVINCQNVCYM